jgi:hypothetical protein
VFILIELIKFTIQQLIVMRYRIIFSLAVSMLIAAFSQAQRIKPSLKEISLNNLESFQAPTANWKLIGDVEASYNDTALNTAKGLGILHNDFSRSIQNKPVHNLVTKMEHGDMLLEFDFMMAKGSNSGIYFQSRYEVQLFDSWGVKTPRSSDVGGLYQTIKKGMSGKAPMKNAALAPGLWQHMDISFQAPRFDANGNKTASAKFIYVKLNGITLHENINVDGPTISASFSDEEPYGPLMIQGDHGTFAIKNLKYLPQDDLKVDLRNISYQYFEKTATSLAQAKTTKPTLQGKASVIDSRVAPARDKFLLVFEGKLNIPTADSYTFTSLFSGTGSLEIDGKKVLEAKDLFLNGTPVSGTTELKAGEHAFKFWINKDLDWARPGLSLYIEKANSKSIALHAAGSIPDRSPAPLIAVKAESGPEMIRSFMNHNNKKLTHVVSIGDPSQVHYSYDLMQGGILQAWKGDFLNTTDMWHERGEPQTATPLGAPIVLAGNCPIYEKPLTKDSIADYQYKGYTLKAGLPTFAYTYKALSIKDRIQPEGKGLKRSITVSGEGKEKTMIRIAQGSSITPLGKGLYSIGNQAYFVQLAAGQYPKIEGFLGQQVLLLPAGETIEYQLIW